MFPVSFLFSHRIAVYFSKSNNFLVCIESQQHQQCSNPYRVECVFSLAAAVEWKKTGEKVEFSNGHPRRRLIPSNIFLFVFYQFRTFFFSRCAASCSENQWKIHQATVEKEGCRWVEREVKCVWWIKPIPSRHRSLPTSNPYIISSSSSLKQQQQRETFNSHSASFSIDK